MSTGRYVLRTTDDGFAVVGKDRRDVCFSLNESKTGIVVSSDDKCATKTFGLIEFSKIIEKASHISLSYWKVPETHKKKLGGFGRDKKRIDSAYGWMYTAWQRGLSRRISERLRVLQTKALPEALSVQKATFSVAGKIAPITLEYPGVYANSYFVKDVLVYRAAAILCHLLEQRNTSFLIKGLEGDIDDELSLSWDGNFLFSTDQLHLWLKFLSRGKPSASLTKTIYGLPGGFPKHLLLELKAEAALERPITDRLELISWCVARTHYLERECNHSRVMQRSTRKKIKKAIQLVAEYQRTEKVKLRRWIDINLYISFICDFDEPHNGNVVGLAAKSIEWHRNRAWSRKVGGNTPLETTTAVPEIPLPDAPGIRFLSTVGDVVEEGEAMHHCISGYANLAVKGTVYLFHVEYDGERASAEVSNMGIVKQVRGPYNSSNKATEYGKAKLSKWGANLVAQSDRILEHAA